MMNAENVADGAHVSAPSVRGLAASGSAAGADRARRHCHSGRFQSSPCWIATEPFPSFRGTDVWRVTSFAVLVLLIDGRGSATLHPWLRQSPRPCSPLRLPSAWPLRLRPAEFFWLRYCVASFSSWLAVLVGTHHVGKGIGHFGRRLHVTKVHGGDGDTGLIVIRAALG